LCETTTSMSTQPARSYLAARLVSVSLQGLFYGILVVSMGFVVRSLFFYKTHGPTDFNKMILATTIVLFVISSIDFAANIYFVLVTFVLPMQGVGSVVGLQSESFRASLILAVGGCLNALVADAALLYRCFVVYDHRWLVILFPLLLWIGNFASCAWLVFTTAKHDTSKLQNARFTGPTISFLALSTVTTTITTGLIAYRIWKATNRSSPFSITTSHGRSLTRTARIVIESGVIVAFTGILLLVCYFSSELAIDSTVNAVTPLVGIAFNLTTIRARQHYRDGNNDTNQLSLSTNFSLNLSSHIAAKSPASDVLVCSESKGVSD